MEVSGVVATTCKHVLFRAGSVVDMQRGETCVNVFYLRYKFCSHLAHSNIHHDFSLAGALRGTEDLEERGYTYDVICSRIRNIIARFRKHHPQLVPIVEQLQCLLPSMHLHAHKELCQITYALAYAAGFGLTHGEGVETPWAEFNIAGLTTREMTAGARHDAINDLFNFWNWGKNETLRAYEHRVFVDTAIPPLIQSADKFLARKLTEAYAARERTAKYFAGLTGIAGVAQVSEWLAIDFDGKAPTPLTFREKEAAWAKSPFLVNREKRELKTLCMS